ncbi:28214_t:CDS:2 [Dentiscutata erythropus]|uniref:28214_t:CDS:1 n=1 Tax=Dentiscutata erythropus TaxID=1348616 RepID=A0A9N9DDG1_9GLOM|nr:28214_t:CDS:2 [Dentiscutata erythropus]
MIRNKFGSKNHKKAVYIRQRFSSNSFNSLAQSHNSSLLVNKEKPSSLEDLSFSNKTISETSDYIENLQPYKELDKDSSFLEASYFSEELTNTNSNFSDDSFFSDETSENLENSCHLNYSTSEDSRFFDEIAESPLFGQESITINEEIFYTGDFSYYQDNIKQLGQIRAIILLDNILKLKIQKTIEYHELPKNLYSKDRQFRAQSDEV